MTTSFGNSKPEQEFPHYIVNKMADGKFKIYTNHGTDSDEYKPFMGAGNSYNTKEEAIEMVENYCRIQKELKAQNTIVGRVYP